MVRDSDEASNTSANSETLARSNSSAIYRPKNVGFRLLKLSEIPQDTHRTLGVEAGLILLVRLLFLLHLTHL